MKVTKVKAKQLDAILPQTQCSECGYNGCKPYAEAMANGEADINLCPPGGVNTLQKLADLLKRDAKPYIDQLKEKYRAPSIAIIDENLCIGCVKCIKACPIDAIVGAPKLMHTVIKAECSGCELCIPVCPMDCIQMEVLPERSIDEQEIKSRHWRERYDARNTRLSKNEVIKQARHEAAKLNKQETERKNKRAVIAAAIARSKMKRNKSNE